jgi:hypothetical protein
MLSHRATDLIHNGLGGVSVLTGHVELATVTIQRRERVEAECLCTPSTLSAGDGYSPGQGSRGGVEGPGQSLDTAEVGQHPHDGRVAVLIGPIGAHGAA